LRFEKIRAGIQTGSSIPADEVFNRLEAKYQAMLEPPSNGFGSASCLIRSK
jgi:hypothetical protein